MYTHCTNVCDIPTFLSSCSFTGLPHRAQYVLINEYAHVYVSYTEEKCIHTYINWYMYMYACSICTHVSQFPVSHWQVSVPSHLPMAHTPIQPLPAMKLCRPPQASSRDTAGWLTAVEGHSWSTALPPLSAATTVGAG